MWCSRLFDQFSEKKNRLFKSTENARFLINSFAYTKKEMLFTIGYILGILLAHSKCDKISSVKAFPVRSKYV